MPNLEQQAQLGRVRRTGRAEVGLEDLGDHLPRVGLGLGLGLALGSGLGLGLG